MTIATAEKRFDMRAAVNNPAVPSPRSMQPSRLGRIIDKKPLGMPSHEVQMVSADVAHRFMLLSIKANAETPRWLRLSSPIVTL